MKTYRCEFTGRLSGAIGIFYPCSRVVQAESPEDARLRLYETHEHIQGLVVTEVEDRRFHDHFNQNDR